MKKKEQYIKIENLSVSKVLFDFINKEQNICERAKDIVQGANKQEVVSIPKEPEKKGFFEM